MSKKVVDLTTDRSRFFRQYLELVRIFHPFNNLRAKELDIVSWLFYFNDKYKDLDDTIRWKIIMDYDNKEVIKASCGDMTTANFNNILTSLRKKGFLVDNKIPEKYLLVIDDAFQFTINFKIQE